MSADWLLETAGMNCSTITDTLNPLYNIPPRFVFSCLVSPSAVMSVRPLNDLWEAAAGQSYEPSVGKNSQFTVGFTLLVTGMQQYSIVVIKRTGF